MYPVFDFDPFRFVMVWTLDDTLVLDIPNAPFTWENSEAIKMRSEVLAVSLRIQFSIDLIAFAPEISIA